MSLHVHLVPLGGMAGDMFVAAMLDALPDLVAPVLADVRAVLPDEVAFGLKPVVASGIAAQHFYVSGRDGTAPVTLRDMLARVQDAALSAGVKERTCTLLTALGQAEAEVHQVPLDEVHFHEIADWDTLADLTAAAHLLEYPGIASWSLAPLPLGSGTVESAHGRLSVPAPATCKLLSGLEVMDDGIAGERVTPTGAAIASALRQSTRPAGRMGRTGYGAGSRVLPGVANVLVAQVSQVGAGVRSDRISLLEFDIDDMTGEELATAADLLRATPGVRDLVTFQMQGKKHRTVTGMRLMVDPACAESVATACFEQTTTLGLRQQEVTRRVLRRRDVARDGLAAKEATRPGGATVKVEADALATGATLAQRRALAARGETG